MSRLTMKQVIEHCERVTKRIEENVQYCREWLELKPSPLKSKNYLEHKQTAEWLKELQKYKDLEEQGRLIKAPCKPGDELFVKHRTFGGVIVKGVCIGYTWWRTDGFCIMFHSDTPTYEKVDIAFSEFGKTVFLTEPEAKLAELKDGGGDE